MAKQHTHDVNVGDRKNRSDVRRSSKNTAQHVPMLATPKKPLIASAHSLQWLFEIDGEIMIKADNYAQMRGWTRRFWYSFEGCRIVANVKTLEVWVRKGKQRNPKRMLSMAWSKADMARRRFSEKARVGLIPVQSAHPLDISRGHFVVHNRELKAFLNQFGRELAEYMEGAGFKRGSERIGLIHDKSHGNQPEMIGRESAEGCLGLDWLLLDHKEAHAQGAIRAAQDFTELQADLQLLHSEHLALGQATRQLTEMVLEVRKVQEIHSTAIAKLLKEVHKP
jgi:hypothetical protein